MGELRYVMIRIETHPKFVQVIDIIIVDILEAYGLLLSRDWSENLNGYFSTKWAHLWLPLKVYKYDQNRQGNIFETYCHRPRNLERTFIDRFPCPRQLFLRVVFQELLPYSI